MNKSPGHAPLHGPESVDIAPAPQGNDGFHTNDPNPPGLGSPAPRMREVELNEKGESSQRHGETDADREQRENQQHDDRAAEKVQNDNEKLGSDPDRQQAG